MSPHILNPPSTSLPTLSALSQSTGFGCLAPCIELVLIIYFTYGNVHVLVLFSQIISPSLSPTESKSFELLFLNCIELCKKKMYNIHLSYIYHIYIYIFIIHIYMREWSRSLWSKNHTGKYFRTSRYASWGFWQTMFNSSLKEKKKEFRKMTRFLNTKGKNIIFFFIDKTAGFLNRIF